MVVDPYKTGMFKKSPYFKKAPCEGNLVVVLDGKFDGRGLELINPPSRALLEGEIHELIVTDEQDAAPGKQVNNIAYWGFFRVNKSSVIVSGDEITIAGKCKGHICGFDITHMPNHLNIVVKVDERVPGAEVGLELGDKVFIAGK